MVGAWSIDSAARAPPSSEDAFWREPAPSQGDARPGRAIALEMDREIIREISHCRLQRIGCIPAEAADRTVGHIIGKLVEQRQIGLFADIAHDAFQYPRDEFDA